MKETNNPHGVAPKRTVFNEITARQAHAAIPYSSLRPREAPRTARPSRPVYTALRGWLRRRVATGWDVEWMRIAHIADAATVDLQFPVNPSNIAYVIRQEYPDVPVRKITSSKGDLYDRKRVALEYNVRFLSGSLDRDDEV